LVALSATSYTEIARGDDVYACTPVGANSLATEGLLNMLGRWA